MIAVRAFIFGKTCITMNSGKTFMGANFHKRINTPHVIGQIIDHLIKRFLYSFNISVMVLMKINCIIVKFKVQKKLYRVIRKSEKHTSSVLFNTQKANLKTDFGLFAEGNRLNTRQSDAELIRLTQANI